MKLSEVSGLQLAAVVAGATFLGGISSSLLGVFLVDAGTERQTDVQLVQLAIGILSEPLTADPAEAQPLGVSETPETALREWAVDTINAAADVKFDEDSRAMLISGQAQFSGELPTTVKGYLEEAARRLDRLEEAARQLKEAQPDGESTAP